MNPKTKAGLIALMLFIMLIPGRPETVMVYADGASSIEEVYIEWYEDTWTGQGVDTDTDSSLDGNYFGVYIDPDFNFTELDVDTVNITRLRTYVEWDLTNEGFTRDWRVAAHNYTAINDGGALIAFEDWELQNVDGTPAVNGYVTRTLADEWELDARAYFIGFGCSDSAGAVRMYRQTNGAAGSGSLLDNTGWEGADPFNEFTNWNTEEWNIQIKYTGAKLELTETNIYVGNVTHYIARRDLNYTFPAGAADEQIQMTFPLGEQILNITRENGGAWNEVLAEAEYSTDTLNGTHSILTIPEATINLYGGLYRVYTSTFDYLYLIGGAFYENGTSYGAVNITATYEGGSTAYEVDGPIQVGTDTEIILFQWDVGNAVRFYYTRSGQEEFNIFFPEAAYDTYEFEIRDLSGDLQAHLAGQYCQLESLRYINNTLEVIERITISDVVNDVPLTLVTYQVYRLRVLHPDEHVIDFGIMVSGVVSDYTLVIDEIEFSAQAQITYQYVTVEALRATPTQITVNYNDSLAQTTDVSFYLEFRNGTDVYNETSIDDNYQFNYVGVDAFTDYQITVVINHETFGTLTYQEILGVERSFNPAPKWSMIGTVGPIDVGNLISLFLVTVIALGFSAVNAEAGGFAAVALAFILRYWEWNTFDYTVLGICMGIVLIAGMVRRSTG